MNVLLLGASSARLESYITAAGDSFIRMDEKITVRDIHSNEIDLIVSYGYRHILKSELLCMCRAVNLHISYLPWNRGADPNLWSFLERSPRGVTIHYMDSGLDTGDIIVQRSAEPVTNASTLRTTYLTLTNQIESLFAEHWQAIKQQDCVATLQSGTGSYHKSADKVEYESLLRLGWDTPVCELLGAAFRDKLERTGSSL